MEVIPHAWWTITGYTYYKVTATASAYISSWVLATHSSLSLKPTVLLLSRYCKQGRCKMLHV